MGDKLHMLFSNRLRAKKMRTAQIKLNNETTTALLVAGGAGFKIYSSTTVRGWILSLGRKYFVIDESTLQFKTVSNYINLKYQTAEVAEKVQSEFQILLKSFSSQTTSDPAGPNI